MRPQVGYFAGMCRLSLLPVVVWATSVVAQDSWLLAVLVSLCATHAFASHHGLGHAGFPGGDVALIYFRVNWALQSSDFSRFILPLVKHNVERLCLYYVCEVGH
jgi:hypothetical protein